MKRANGTGTISHRRDKKRRKPYSVYLDGGHDDNGKRIRISLGSYKSYREAQDALDRYRLGVTIQPSPKTTIQDVWELLEAHSAKKINANYRSTYKNYIQPYLRNTPVAELKTMHLQNVINRCPSPSVQVFIRAVLKNIFSCAVANDIAAKDYSATLQVTAPAEKKNPHKPFTTREMRWLWTQTEDAYKIMLIQIYTGMRKGELSGMLLQDVHLDGRYMVGGLKTAAGRNRTIPIARCILPYVEHFYRISRSAGHDYLLMPDLSRRLYSFRGMVNIGYVYTEKFPGHSATHDARHTFVTLCSNYGAPAESVKKIIGHKSSDVTSDVYTHKTLDQLLSVVDSLPFGPEMTMAPGEKVVATGLPRTGHPS